MEHLNLYREAKEQYEKLIPERNDGLILISLYDKYKDRDFTEENIISIINKVFRDQGADTTRIEYNRNNVIILRLQESFLWRNQSRRTYQFKKYGLEFCQNIEKRLIDKYNPAKIKRFFTELQLTLTQNIEEDNDFNEWIEDYFNVRMPALASQIEILDQQVNESVNEFKISFKSAEGSIIQILHAIEIRLDIIKEQSAELKDAFQISYDIDELLTTILERQEERYLDNVHRVQAFHESCRSQLEQVSKRIEKIKPRLREFIYDFNKKDFDRKTNKFIGYLLEKSTTKRENNLRKVQLPYNVSSLKIKSTEDSQLFTIIPIRKISRKEAVVATKKPIDAIRSKELMEKVIAKRKDKERISILIKDIFDNLEQSGTLVFTPLFFRIIESDNLAIAVRTTHGVLRHCAKHRQKYQVTIRNRRTSELQHKNISIWQMTLQKR